MPSVKIKDLQRGGSSMQERKDELWNLNFIHQIKAWKIENGVHAFYMLVGENFLYKFADTSIKNAFQDKNFEIITPTQEASIRSVMAKHVDNHVVRYEEEEIKASINNQNEWAEVEEIKKISTKAGPVIVKIKFQQATMAQKALSGGLMILSQSLPAWAIEEETYVPINPCNNCYSYYHIKRNCPRPSITLCSKCSMTGHKRFSCNNNFKCIHCQEPHPTFHPQCKAKKKYLREEGAKIRNEKKNNNLRTNRASPYQTYASTVAPGSNISTSNNPTVQNQNQNHNCNCNSPLLQIQPIDKEVNTKIMTGISYAHFMDSLEPGTFQNLMDEFFLLNNLPQVKFPRKITPVTTSNASHNPPSHIPNSNEATSEETNNSASNTNSPESSNILVLEDATEDTVLAPNTTDNMAQTTNTSIVMASGEEAEATMSVSNQNSNDINITITPTEDSAAFVAPTASITSQEDRSRKTQRDGNSKTRKTIRSSSRKLRHTSVNRKSLKDYKLSVYYPKSWKEEGKRTDIPYLVDMFLNKQLPFNHDGTLSSVKLREKVYDLVIKKALLDDAISFNEIPDDNYNEIRNNMATLEKNARIKSAEANING